jgi:hypothetical protein
VVALWYVWLLGKSIWNGVIVALPVFNSKYITFIHSPLAFIANVLFYGLFALYLIFFAWSVVQRLLKVVLPVECKWLASQSKYSSVNEAHSNSLAGRIFSFAQRPVAVVRIDDGRVSMLLVNNQDVVDIIFESNIQMENISDIYKTLSRGIADLRQKARKDYGQLLKPTILIHVMPSTKSSRLERQKKDFAKRIVSSGVARVYLSFQPAPPSIANIIEFGRLMR